MTPTAKALLLASWALFSSAPVHAQAEPSIGGEASAKPTSPAEPGSPSPKVKGKAKRKPIKVTAQPVEPSDPAPVVETTKFEPELIYRMASLVSKPASVYKKDPTKSADFSDQIYVTLRFSRTYNYVHEIVIEPTLRTDREAPSSWDNDHFADQAYTESAINPWLTLTAGKKTEYSGFGFFLNPSDLLNENKENFDALYQREGVVFGRLRATAGAFSLGLGFIPERGESANDGRAWLTLGGQMAEVDLVLSATYHDASAEQAEKGTVGFSAQRFFGSSFELHTDSRYQQRQRHQHADNDEPHSAYAGDITTSTEDDDASGYFLNGTRYVFTHQRTAVLEYIVNQAGLLPEEFKLYHGKLRERQEESSLDVKNPPQHILGRHYLFLGYSDESIAKGLKLSMNALQNTDDRSSFVSLSARYHLSPITSVELAPSFFTGAVDSEFGEMPFASITYLTFRGRF